MKSFADHKKELAGYEDVLETVQVLEKVAAGKLRALEQRSEALASYTHVIAELMVRLENFTNTTFSGARSENKKTHHSDLLLVLTGDRGLVGDLWHRLFDFYTEQKADFSQLLVIGAKGQALWPRSHTISHHTFDDRLPTHDEVAVLAKILSEGLIEKRYTSVSVLYPKPLSLINYQPTIMQLLPLVVAVADSVVQKTPVVGYPIIEGSAEIYRTSLLEKYLVSRLQQVLQETALSEFSARTVGLEHAGAKTESIIDDSVRQYRRWRRQADTAKQLERFVAITSL